MKTKIKKTLQLDNKWVRVMLMVSLLIIVSLSFYPENGISFKSAKKSAESIYYEPMMLDTVNFYDSEMLMTDDSTAIPESRMAVPEAREPIEIKIVTEPQPFDWKTMISWMVGSMNGVVLLIMNLKNIKKK